MFPNKRNVKKIVLTGGHAGSTAYAVVEELRRDSGDWEIFWVGSSQALEGKNIPTFESEVFHKIGVNFHSIFMGRIQRRFSTRTIPSLLKIPVGFLHAVFLLQKIKPSVVLSFGGYSAFPIVVVSWMKKIPVIIHEQTMVAGRANRYSSFFATRIALARKESKKYFPKDKCVITGNPVSDGIRSIKPRGKISEKPTLFITGGSRGAIKINDLVDQILEEILSEFKVVHQTGLHQLKKFISKKAKLPRKLRKKYEVYGFIKPWFWFKFIKKSDIIVSRSGANIVSEIIVSKRPSILIPLPIAYLNEQKRNAEFARDFGIATVLEQENITAEILIKEIYKIRKNWSTIVNRVKNKKSPDINAAKKLVNLIKEELL